MDELIGGTNTAAGSTGMARQHAEGHVFPNIPKRPVHDCIQPLQVTTVRTLPVDMHKVMQVLHIFCL